MAASEGQLAVEFVQALTEEARAHREYLQTLYTQTAAIIGIAIAVFVTIGTIIARYMLKQAKDALASMYEQELQRSLKDVELSAAKKREEFQNRLSALSNKIRELERGVKEADQARLSAQSESISMLQKFDEFQNKAINIFEEFESFMQSLRSNAENVNEGIDSDINTMIANIESVKSYSRDYIDDEFNRRIDQAFDEIAGLTTDFSQLAAEVSAISVLVDSHQSDIQILNFETGVRDDFNRRD